MFVKADLFIYIAQINVSALHRIICLLCVYICHYKFDCCLTLQCFTLFNVKCVRLFSVMQVTCISDISQSNQNHTPHLLPCTVLTFGGVIGLKKSHLLPCTILTCGGVRDLKEKSHLLPCTLLTCGGVRDLKKKSHLYSTDMWWRERSKEEESPAALYSTDMWRREI